MDRTFIYGWKMGSKTVSSLTKGLGIKAIRHEGSKFKASPKTQVINWGSSSLPKEVLNGKVLNMPDAVGEVTNKLKFFKMMEDVEGVHIPEFTTEKDKVQEWLNEKKIVFARHKLQAHSGEGIAELSEGDPIPNAPLYTLYIPKKDEYRVHVMAGKIIDIQRKALNRDVPRENANWRIRNHDGGFIFAREGGIKLPAGCRENVLKCFKATGLDFCSIDLIYNKKRKQSYVLEANTATGLTGTTLDNYVAGFKEHFNV